jgi:RimJ/RimL family protein N-acetyltransferase
MFRLETARLLIRPWEREDRPALRALMNDPLVNQYVHDSRPYSEEELDEIFLRRERSLVEHGVCMGALIEKAGGHLIGTAGVQPLGTTGDMEIGWILAPDVWGKGYATEAGAAARDHVLVTLGRSRVVAIIHPENQPSKRVAARLGMEYEARYTGAELGHRSPEIVVDLFFRSKP